MLVGFGDHAADGLASAETIADSSLATAVNGKRAASSSGGRLNAPLRLHRVPNPKPHLPAPCSRNKGRVG